MDLLQGFALAAVAEREDPRDAFVSVQYRQCPLCRRAPDRHIESATRESGACALSVARCCPVRGNVQTRLRKLDEGQYAGIVLATAGLKRLGLETRITAVLEPEESLPAPGQGAIGVECLEQPRDLIELLVRSIIARRSGAYVRSARSAGTLSAAAWSRWAHSRSRLGSESGCAHSWRVRMARATSQPRAVPGFARIRKNWSRGGGKLVAAGARNILRRSRMKSESSQPCDGRHDSGDAARASGERAAPTDRAGRWPIPVVSRHGDRTAHGSRRPRSHCCTKLRASISRSS
jgi:hypothetical protein